VGWESEDAYNDYLGSVLNAIPKNRLTPQMEEKIQHYVEAGLFGNLNNFLDEKRLKEASRWVGQHGGQMGPDTFIEKGYSVYNPETGKYDMQMSDEETKNLESLQDEYEETHNRYTDKNYGKNSPVSGGRILRNPFDE